MLQELKLSGSNWVTSYNLSGSWIFFVVLENYSVKSGPCPKEKKAYHMILILTVPIRVTSLLQSTNLTYHKDSSPRNCEFKQNYLRKDR